MEESNKTKRIYLSYPISGCDMEETRLKALKKKQELESAGWVVFNPLENGLPEDAGTHAHMHRDLAELTNEEHPYDAIYMMTRCFHSAGCMTEFHVATAIGLEVYFEDCYAVGECDAVKFK